MTGNGDNHLKNISFVVDHEKVRVAPAYDLLATAVYDTRAIALENARWPASELALQVSDESKTFGSVTYKDLFNAGLALGLGKTTISREISRQADSIQHVASQLFDEVCEEHERLVALSPDQAEARKHWGIEEKVLLATRHIILADMVRRVGRFDEGQ